MPAALCFQNSSPPPQDAALVTLLRQYRKKQQAEAAIAGDLVELNFGGSKIGDDGAEIVAEFLKHDNCVKYLWLNHNEIGLRGIKAIAEALKHNRTLENLNVISCQLSDEGFRSLKRAFDYNVCLTDCRISTTMSAFDSGIAIHRLSQIRNATLIPAAVRRATLCIIAARRNADDAGLLSVFPKEIVKMIAIEVYATRKDPKWIEALAETERTGESS